jgi:hypothetical protein
VVEEHCPGRITGKRARVGRRIPPRGRASHGEVAFEPRADGIALADVDDGHLGIVVTSGKNVGAGPAELPPPPGGREEALGHDNADAGPVPVGFVDDAESVGGAGGGEIWMEKRRGGMVCASCVTDAATTPAKCRSDTA